MSESREMTLREWTMRLPEGHLANKQLTILESSLAQAQADVEALQKKSLRLQAALYDALTMRLFPGDIEVQDIVLDHDEGLAEIEAALPEHLRGSK